MQAAIITALYILTVVFTYSVYKDLRKPPEPLRTDPERMQEEKPVPVILPTPPAIVVKPEPTPEPVKPEPIPETEPPKMDRKKLEQTARNCLTAAGCTFDTWSYTRYKSDIELMDIIKEYNLNK